MYIASGIMSVVVIVLLLMIMIFTNILKSKMVQVSSAFPSESPILVHDSKQSHDELSKIMKASALVHGSKLS